MFVHNLAPKQRGQESEERGRPLQTGRLNKQGNKACLGYVPARILKVVREALTGFGHMQHPAGLNNTLLSQDCGLGTVQAMGTEGRSYIPRTEGRGEEQGVQLSCQPVVCPLDPLQQLRRQVEPIGSDCVST